MDRMDAIPAAFGRYRVVEILGKGAMGAVYRAHDPLIDRAVAVKVIRAELLEGQERQDFRARFRVEAQAAGRCAHPNIVAIHDFSDAGDAPYIVMELVEGETLQIALRRRGRLEPAEATSIALEILSALEFAHAARITHRDIKPANIVLMPDGRLKVMDFGIARLSSASATLAGTLVGTPSYMAPEQVLGTTVDHRCDLFQTGIVLFEMLAGRTPFAGETTTQILYRVAHQDLSLGDELDAVPPAIAKVLRQALAHDPNCRFPSAADFASSLRTASSGQPFPVPDGDATVFAPSRRAAPAVAVTPGPPGEAAIDPAILTRAEQELASHIGPVARVLVRKTAQSAIDAEDLYRRLAENIPKEEERTRFLSRGGRRTGGGSLSSRPGVADPNAGSGTSLPARPGAVSAIDAAEAEAALTPFLGPIAKVLVRKTASQAPSLDDFHERLAEHLDGQARRAAFFRTVRGIGAQRGR